MMTVFSIERPQWELMRFLLFLALLPALYALDIQEKGVEDRAGVKIHDITFANLAGGRTAAYLVASAKPGKSAAILFVHWLEPQAKDSNRTQFLGQAVETGKARHDVAAHRNHVVRP